MTGPRGPDEFKALDEHGVKESQIGTQIVSERLVNLQDVRLERSLLKTIWTSLVFVSGCTKHFKAAGRLSPHSRCLMQPVLKFYYRHQRSTAREWAAVFPWRRVCVSGNK